MPVTVDAGIALIYHYGNSACCNVVNGKKIFMGLVVYVVTQSLIIHSYTCVYLRYVFPVASDAGGNMAS